jgi:cell wall-associated NlpC family hydrolase
MRHHHIHLILLIAFTFVIGGCSWGGSGATRGGDASVRSEAARTATQMVGVPYRYGGRTPDGFDCSGLVFFSYSRAGITVPRTSRDQLRASTPIKLGDAAPGDLLFFSEGSKSSHVAIYLGGGRFVHAPSTGRQVSIADMNNPYYREHFVRAGRLY